MNKTIAQQLGVTDFPFEIKDKNGKTIYYEFSDNLWERWERDSDGNPIYYERFDGYSARSEYDSNGNRVYFENSKGVIIDNRPKQTTEQ